MIPVRFIQSAQAVLLTYLSRRYRRLRLLKQKSEAVTARIRNIAAKASQAAVALKVSGAAVH